MENPGGHDQNEILFQYSWAVVRELDRINRSSQKTVSLDARIHKLRAMAEPYLMSSDGNVKPDYEDWYEKWEDLDPEEFKVPKEVRWKQLRLLIQLFHREGVFEEEGLHWEDIAYWEYDLD